MLSETIRPIMLKELIVKNVLQELSSFIKNEGLSRNEENVGVSVVSLCADQDNWLIEAMLCCLDIYLTLQESKK